MSTDVRSSDTYELFDLLLEDQRNEILAAVVAYFTDQIECAKASLPLKALHRSREKSPFYNKCTPRISLHDYVHRIAKFTSVSSVCFVLACSYIDRLCKADERCQVNHHTAHRLILCAVLLAAKLTDDRFRSNSYFSKVGGVSMSVLHEMEVCMFRKLGFSLHLTEHQIKSQLEKLTSSIKNRNQPSATDSRGSRKRVSEDYHMGSEHCIPSKVAHDSQHKEVLVVQTSPHRRSELTKLSHSLQECGESISESLDVPTGEERMMSAVDMSLPYSKKDFKSHQDASLHQESSLHQENDSRKLQSLVISESCAKEYRHLDRLTSSGLLELQ